MEMINTVAKVNSPKDLITQLKAEVSKNRVFNDMCHVFATRERARQQVTIPALMAVMKKNGFNHSKNDYEKALRVMANLGLGILDFDGRGRLRSLKGVKVTLQSIGMAALSGGQINKFRPQVRLAKLPGVPQTIVEAAASKTTITPPPTIPDMNKDMCKIVFTVEVGGKKVLFEIPEGVPKEELGQFIAGLYPRKPRIGA